MIRYTKDMLKSKFDMKDMGLADVILKIKIIRTHNGLVFSQAHYVDKLLNTYNAGNSGLARTPIDTSMLSRYTSNLSDAHWKAMTSDANWISDIKDFRTTSGYVFTLGGATISWKSSKLTFIAKSTMESGFIALDKCIEKAEWILQLVEDIPRWPKSDNIADPLTKDLSRELISESSKRNRTKALKGMSFYEGKPNPVD
ncbi:hypothetical protein Tco_1069800 [Tanacetum coccineum]|uniref:Zinc finger, CCHC-type n=1 Tax=Tanacetum coccineum TaxID=301880 RepID=A0ABQ5HJK6_9ASTR